MMRAPAPFRPDGLRTELALHLPDGTPWVLTVSPGIERFIGWYPRVDGLRSEGPLLAFRTVDPATS